ncbi:MAG: acyl-CoA dehydrogenase family protein [Proteobacteria bacterium]|nr:acyl-CoA dehydrogenase family protein [Pseudomonadota bacterium]
MVDFELSKPQKQIVAAARDFGKNILLPAETELDKIPDPQAVFTSECFRAVIAQAFELGFSKMALPEKFGGMGLDPQTTGMVWEEIARWGPGFAATLIPGAVVPQLISFLAPDNRELVDKFVIPYCEDITGRYLTAWCSSEPEVGSDGSNYKDLNVRHHTVAEQSANGYMLSGTKSDFVSNGGIASSYIVFACIDPSMGIKGSGTFVVPGDAPGLKTGRPLDKIGLRVLNQSPVFFDRVEVPSEYLIFPCGDGYPMLHNAIVTVGNLAVGYIAVGLMRAAYECALAHAKKRVQWGKPIFQHELIAKKLFECFQAIETARAFLWKGSWLSGKSFPGDLKTSIAAKVYATDQAVRHTAEMVQILGGYGISREYPVEKYSRDAKLLKIMDGTNETLLIKAAALL